MYHLIYICSAGDPGSIPGTERSPGVGNGNPLQYSCLGNSWTEKPGGLQSWGHQESDMTERPSLSSLTCGKCTYCKYTSTVILCMPIYAPSILSNSIFQHPLEHPSSGFWEECGSLGLKPALFILGVSQPFLSTTPLASGLNYPPHWLKTGFLNLRGKVSAAAFPSFKLIHSSLSTFS